MNRIANGLMLVILVGVLSIVFTNTSFAGGPKCPCFKAKDIEKLMKKGGAVLFTSNEENEKFVIIDLPEQPWDVGTKGKAVQTSFRWNAGDPEDICQFQELQMKWKSPNYRDDKMKTKRRPMVTGDENSAECTAILDDFISSLP